MNDNYKNQKHIRAAVTEAITQEEHQHSFIGDLHRIKDHLVTNWDSLDMDDISRAQAKISILLINFGDLVARMVAHKNTAYIYRKLAYADSFNTAKAGVDKKISVAVAEAAATADIKDMFDNDLIRGWVADHFKTKYDSYSRLVMSLQTRCSTQRSEAYATKSQV